LVLAGLIVMSIAALRLGALAALLAAPVQQRLAAGAALLLALIALGLAWWPAQLPPVLIDGPYVVKQNLPAVRVQHISGALPIDNAIPHVASEYLLRSISFASERPLMPGQEVSNRPVLTSLVLMPWRALLPIPTEQVGQLPRFSYVGASWPDFSIFLQDHSAWAVSVAIGSALNALLLLAVGAWLTVDRRAGTSATLLFSLLALSSPYVLIQTFYTWPKALAGFFIVIAYIALRRGLSPLASGTALGLAYLSHPYAVAYAVGFGLWWLGRSTAGAEATTSRLKPPAQFVVAVVVVVAPWFIWSRLWLQIPSDLVAQNLLQAGQRWIDFAWVRSLNLVATLAPLHLQIYPYEAAAVFRSASVNLCGAMGLIPALFLLRDWIKRPGYHLTVAAFPILLPALLLVAIFSGPAIPAVHGLQPLVVMGLATAVSGSDPVTRCRLILLGLIGQVVINLLLTGQYLAGIL
jgi:hypothetical protein